MNPPQVSTHSAKNLHPRPPGSRAATDARSTDSSAYRRSIIRQIRVIGFWILLLAAFAQPLINSDSENIAMVLLTVVVSLIAGAYGLRERMFVEVPISTLQVLGLAGTMLAFPLLFVTLEWHPLTFNLQSPLRTFGYSALTVLTAIVAHIIYRWSPIFAHLRARVIGRVLMPAGVFEPLPNGAFWMMGLLGWGAMFYVYVFLPDRGTVSTGALDKIIQALASFVYAPLVIPFIRLCGGGKRASGRDWVMLSAYMVSIFILAMSRNSRGVFAVPILLVGLAILLGGLLGHFPVRLIGLKTAVAVLILGVVSLGLGDLALAMQIARGARGQVSSRELARMSVAIMFDRSRLREMRAEEYSLITAESGWSEYYIANPFLARFANPKFLDNSVTLTGELSEADRLELLRVSMQKMAAILPESFLYLLQIHIDKQSVTSFSSGDYVYYLATGRGLGAMRGGSFIGSGVFLFSWGYPVVLMVAVMGFFLFGDMLVLQTNPGGWSGRNTALAPILIAPFGLIWSTNLIFAFDTESLTDFPSVLLRGLLQSLVFYVVIAKVCRTIVGSVRLSGTGGP